MANPRHLEIFKQGVEAWNRWRKENSGVLPDLSDAADLGGAYLHGVDLNGADLHDTDLRQAVLRGADLHEAILVGADLSRADLSGADFGGAYLSRACLHEATLFRVDLCEAILRGADLHEATLYRVDLSRAQLTEADLSGAHLSGTNLHKAILCEADLRGTILRGVHLTGADVSECRLGYTVFADIDLSAVVGLDRVRHLGPSTVGIDTICRSRGAMPDGFLRGTGVPEWFVAYARSLRTRRVQSDSCFISYAPSEQELAERLRADLEARGVRCWFAPEGMGIGARVHVALDEAARMYDRLLLIFSATSVGSPWMESEVEGALEKERQESRLVLFPIRVDEAIVKATAGWATRVKQTHRLRDFRQWQDAAAYQKALGRLLRDLGH